MTIMLSKQIKNNLLKLNDLEKIEAIELLSDCMDKPDPEIEKIIVSESDRRFKAYKTGKIKARKISEILRIYK